MEQASLRIALLIDADNASVATLDYVLSEIADLGVANVRRAYGDWGNPHLRPWRDALLANAIQPIQQVAYTNKGNASDMAMVIEAMDLLHARQFDAFALMSSDSDFTPLAMRLRAANMQVYGFGKAKTPTAFKAACSVFFHVDAQEEPAVPESPVDVAARPGKVTTQPGGPTDGASVPGPAPAPSSQSTINLVQPPSKKSGEELRSDANLLNLLRNAVQATKAEDGWSNLGAVGNHMANRGAFTPKNYGYSTLKPLINATGLYEIRKDGNHVRPKAAKKSPAKTTKKAARKAAGG
jgi:uncharacterized LabA/DUF88 family protein